MKNNKEITKALKKLSKAINNYADAIPKSKPYWEELSEEDKKKWSEILASTPLPDLTLEGIKNASSKLIDFDLPRRNNYSDTIEKPELEIDKWYKFKGVYAVYQGEGVNTYGIEGSLGFCDSFSLDWSQDWKPATEEEVQSALEAEAKKRYSEGDKVECLTEVGFSNGEVYHEKFFYTSNGLWIEGEGDKCNTQIFCDGKWAKVVEKAKKESRYVIDIDKNVGIPTHRTIINENTPISEIGEEFIITLPKSIENRVKLKFI